MINPSQTSLLFITGYFQHILRVIKTDLGHGNWEVINHNNSSFKALLCLSSLYLSSFSSAEVLKNPINCFNSSCGMYRQNHCMQIKCNLSYVGFPAGSDGKKSARGRPGFDPWVGKIPWRTKWQPTPVFLPGKSHGWRSLMGYCPLPPATVHGVAKSGTQLSNFTFTFHFLSCTQVFRC